MTSGGDTRVADAERLLAERGIAGARVEAAGPEREVAVLRVGEQDWPRILEEEAQEIAALLRALGFRFVALDLDLETGPSAE